MKRFAWVLAALAMFVLSACQSVDLDKAGADSVVTNHVDIKATESGGETAGDPLPIFIGTMVSDIGRGERVGSYIYVPFLCDPSGGPITWNPGRQRIIDTDSLATMAAYMKDEGITVTNDPIDLDRRYGSKEVSPAYLIAGTLKKLTINVCRSWPSMGSRAKGDALARISWKIFALTPGENVLVQEIETDGRIDSQSAGAHGIEPLIVEVMGVAAAELARSPEFIAMISHDFRKELVEREQERMASLEEWRLPIEAASSEDIQTIMTRVRASAVRIDTDGGHGSGVLVSPKMVLTNHHVAGGNEFVEVVLSTGRTVIGEVMRCHRARDICLILIEETGLPYRPIRLDNPEVGEEIYVIGAPAYKANRGTVTRGIISRYDVRSDGLEDIVFDATVHGGNSGGPIFDRYGNIVGLVYAGQESRQGDDLQLNLGVPILDGLRKIKVDPYVDETS